MIAFSIVITIVTVLLSTAFVIRSFNNNLTKIDKLVDEMRIFSIKMEIVDKLAEESEKPVNQTVELGESVKDNEQFSKIKPEDLVILTVLENDGFPGSRLVTKEVAEGLKESGFDMSRLLANDFHNYIRKNNIKLDLQNTVDWPKEDLSKISRLSDLTFDPYDISSVISNSRGPYVVRYMAADGKSVISKYTDSLYLYQSYAKQFSTAIYDGIPSEEQFQNFLVLTEQGLLSLRDIP